MNPLKNFFRQPSLYISLPSQGMFWPPDTLELPPNRELAVMSMTANDEILLRVPDALFNGDAIVNLIQNCVPGIKNAWAMPVSDLEILLVAIKIASGNQNFEVNVKCPECDKLSDFEINLQHQLETFGSPNWLEPLTVGNLKFFFKPINFLEYTEFHNISFKCQKLMNQLSEINSREERERITNQVVSDLAKSDIKFTTMSVHKVVIENQVVNNFDYIQEFINNCEKQTYQKLKNHVEQLKKQSLSAPCTFQCDHCQHVFTVPFSLDYSNFFV